MTTERGRWGRLGGGVAGLVFLFGVGCGGAETPRAQQAEAPETRSEDLVHEPCNPAHPAAEKAEIQRETDGSGREKCRVVDLDHDGKPDLYEYLDSSGAIRRREFCYGGGGSISAIEHYEGGRLTKRELDLSGRKKIDTWDWFDPGAPLDPKTGRPAHPSRRERDTNGDGQVDQWWTWNGDKLTIAIDRTGTGKPDPDSEVEIGGSGGNAPSAPAEPVDAGASDAGPAPASMAAEGGAT